MTGINGGASAKSILAKPKHRWMAFLLSVLLSLMLGLAPVAQAFAAEGDAVKQEQQAITTQSDSAVPSDSTTQSGSLTASESVTHSAQSAQASNIELDTLADGDVTANATNFPDANWRAYLISRTDKNSDGVFSATERASIKYIDIYNKNITSLKGIEFFTDLTELNCSSNKLTALDLSKNTKLKTLVCSNISLPSVDFNKYTSLTKLDCAKNNWDTLDVSKLTDLETLSCGTMGLTTLDISKNSKLKSLSANANKLTAIDLSNNPALEKLIVQHNQITNIDVSKNPELEMIYLDNNSLQSIDISKNKKLDALTLSRNLLTSIDISGVPGLRLLEVGNNRLPIIDLSKNPATDDLELSPQNLEVALSTGGPKPTVDIKLLVGAGNISKVSFAPSDLTKIGASYNPTTGIVTFNAPITGTTTVTYSYQTSSVHEPTMKVNLEIIPAKVLAGVSRQDTAAQVALEAYSNGVKGVIIANGEGQGQTGKFPDALAASALAGLLEYPILLTTLDVLPSYTANALKKLGPQQVIILGDEKSISAKVVAALGANNPGVPVTRLKGANRIDTAVAIYNYGKDKNGGWAKTAIFADAGNFPDALAIAPLAAHKHYPIFLVQGSSLGKSVANVFNASSFDDAIIVGSNKSVSNKIQASLALILGKDPTRLAGDNRYKTAAAIAVYSVAKGMTYDNAGVATGENFPDALTGGPLLAKHGAVILLATDTDTSTIDLLWGRKDVSKIHILGGESSVSKNVRRVIESRLGWNSGMI